MKVFLTGGTGFIGQALVRALCGRGWDLTVLVRRPDSAAARWIQAQGARVVPGDVTADGPWQQQLAGFDRVLHAAGVYELGADAATVRRMADVNVGGTERVLSSAHAAGVPRTLYLSSVWALGGSGPADQPSQTRDERHRHDGQHPTAYARSKFDAHAVALRWRGRGLPLVTAMPNAVVGANDHAVFGYLLRLQLLGLAPPTAFGLGAVLAFVEVQALANGLCLAAEQAPPGADYLFCGDPLSMRALFAFWTRLSGRHGITLNLPRGLMRPQMAVLESLLRVCGLPAFLSRDAVDTTRHHLDYSAAKARRELGWPHPSPEQLWPGIIQTERQLMDRRRGVLLRLRHAELA